MPDSKITALTALTAADPAVDMFPVVDVSDTTMAASGTTKRISINNILACSPAATLASATISGAATVGTTLGVTGVSTFAAGTALLPALTTTGDTNTGIYYPAADTFAVTTGGTERYRVDSAGNFGIGVTPSAWSNIGNIDLANGFIGISSSGTYGGAIANNAYYNSGWKYKSANYANLYLTAAGEHKWLNAPVGAAAGNAITFTQAMTLDASGNLLVGGTTSPLASRLSLFTTFAQPDGIVIRNTGATAGLYWRFGAVNNSNTLFVMNASSVGVTMADGASAWSSVSDERLKDIIEPISNAVAKIGSLRSVIGKYKSDSEGTRRSFLIAQDVKSVLPEAVDSTDIESLGLRYTEVIPLLVAAIKELTARVQTLETR